MTTRDTGTGDDERVPGRRVVAVLVLTLLAGVPLATGLAAGVPVEIADLRVPAVLVALAVGAVLGAVATGYRDPSGGARTATHVRVWEGVGLVLVARIASLAGRSLAEVAEVLAGWVTRPTTLVDLEVVVLLAVAVGGWGGVLTTLRDLGAAHARGRVRVAGDPLERLTRRFLLVTVVTAVGLGLTARADAPAVVPTLTAGGYLVLAVAGLARVRLGALLTRWAEVGTTVTGEVAGRWRRSSGLLIVAALLLALTVPTPTGVGIVGLLVAGVRAVARGIASVFALLGRIERAPEEPVAPAFDWWGWDPFTDGERRAPRELLPHGLLPPWIEAALPYVGVAVLGLLVFLVLLKVIEAGEETGAEAEPGSAGWLRRLLEALRPRGLLARLRRWLPSGPLAGVWRRIVGSAPAAPGDDRAGRRPEPGPNGPRRRADHRPRQRVLTAYGEVLAAAADRGVARRPSQTPYEFEAALARVLRGERRTLDRLTERFVEARFSEHPVDERAAERAVREAERLCEALTGDAQAGGSSPSGPASS